MGLKGENDLSACPFYPADGQEELGRFERVYEHLQGTAAVAASVLLPWPHEDHQAPMPAPLAFPRQGSTESTDSDL